MYQNMFAAGALHRTLLWELTASLAGFGGANREGGMAHHHTRLEISLLPQVKVTKNCYHPTRLGL